MRPSEPSLHFRGSSTLLICIYLNSSVTVSPSPCAAASKESLTSPSGPTISIFRTSSAWPSSRKPLTRATQPSISPAESRTKLELSRMPMSHLAKAICPASSSPSSKKRYHDGSRPKPSSQARPQASWLRNSSPASSRMRKAMPPSETSVSAML